MARLGDIVLVSVRKGLVALEVSACILSNLLEVETLESAPVLK